MPQVDVLIPTFNRAASLGISLTSLAFQTFPKLNVIISDQSPLNTVNNSDEIKGIVRLLINKGHRVNIFRNIPRQGLAQNRQFLLDKSEAPYVLFMDDDIVIEEDLIERLMATIEREKCGFVGSAPIGLSYIDDIRPDEQEIEFWNGPVEAEVVEPQSKKWERAKLHSAANIYHLQNKLRLSSANQKIYRVAWIGACVLYDRLKLIESGAFEFWRDLPEEHCGEEVLAQYNVMRLHGGCGIIPSGSFHLEVPTTVPNREFNAPSLIFQKKQ